MVIHVRLHGALRDRLPPPARGRIDLTLDGSCRVEDVIARLGLSGPLEVACNDEMVEDVSAPLADGDQLEIFRPVAGG